RVLPEMRASLLKEQLQAINELPSESATKIRAAAGDAVTRIERASRVDWLPIDALVKLLDATFATLGPDDAAKHWHKSTMRAFDLPLIKPFVDGALGLFRLSPAQILLLLPKIDKLMHRNGGAVTVETVSNSESRIRHHDLHEVMLASQAWRASISQSYI